MMRAHPDQHYGCFTYAQHGEDILFLNIFRLLGTEKGRYLDIGAHHPVAISNTKLLYDRGWRGVNVEANPYLMHEFHRQRSDDTNINVAIGTNAGETQLFLYSRASGRNTCDPAEVERMKHWQTPKEMITVPQMTINQLLQTEFRDRAPDLLCLDIEGLDYDVLESADFETYGTPPVVCVETRFSETRKMADMMVKKGYFVYVRAGENLIFMSFRYRERIFGLSVNSVGGQ